VIVYWAGQVKLAADGLLGASPDRTAARSLEETGSGPANTPRTSTVRRLSAAGGPATDECRDSLRPRSAAGHTYDSTFPSLPAEDRPCPRPAWAPGPATPRT